MNTLNIKLLQIEIVLLHEPPNSYHLWPGVQESIIGYAVWVGRKA